MGEKEIENCLMPENPFHTHSFEQNHFKKDAKKVLAQLIKKLEGKMQPRI